MECGLTEQKKNVNFLAIYVVIAGAIACGIVFMVTYYLHMYFQRGYKHRMSKDMVYPAAFSL